MAEAGGQRQASANEYIPYMSRVCIHCQRLPMRKSARMGFGGGVIFWRAKFNLCFFRILKIQFLTQNLFIDGATENHRHDVSDLGVAFRITYVGLSVQYLSRFRPNALADSHDVYLNVPNSFAELCL